MQRDDFAGEGKVRGDRRTTADARRSAWPLCAPSALVAQRPPGQCQPAGPPRSACAPSWRPILRAIVRCASPTATMRAVCELALGENNRIRLEDELLASLADWLSSENVPRRLRLTAESGDSEKKPADRQAFSRSRRCGFAHALEAVADADARVTGFRSSLPILVEPTWTSVAIWTYLASMLSDQFLFST